MPSLNEVFIFSSIKFVNVVVETTPVEVRVERICPFDDWVVKTLARVGWTEGIPLLDDWIEVVLLFVSLVFKSWMLVMLDIREDGGASVVPTCILDDTSFPMEVDVPAVTTIVVELDTFEEEEDEVCRNSYEVVSICSVNIPDDPVDKILSVVTISLPNG